MTVTSFQHTITGQKLLYLNFSSHILVSINHQYYPWQKKNNHNKNTKDYYEILVLVMSSMIFVNPPPRTHFCMTSATGPKLRDLRSFWTLMLRTQRTLVRPINAKHSIDRIFFNFIRDFNLLGQYCDLFII